MPFQRGLDEDFLGHQKKKKKKVFFFSVIHMLKYIYTASSQIPNFPEYMSVGYVDGVQITHYDSKSGKYRLKQDWMNKITAEDPHYRERQTQISIGAEQVSKVDIEIAKERFNQTGGLSPSNFGAFQDISCAGRLFQQTLVYLWARRHVPFSQVFTCTSGCLAVNGTMRPARWTVGNTMLATEKTLYRLI
ncbi:H-2 class I histocompatibility antigen, D-D alpha chain-like [Corythoichthys intestinalis]|uniref:H-2 class I histocompatibility antigen, D-D alpha chain-like n=1 Tax=Corythoichthys intestinalis TaxID=161448 RepID=UPI0025A5675B|nr:H-2 class I histocompatibility antigen, D-D alpha chain-like [Corythoichthys intestinalis]